jgi:hypothetical protein
LDFSVAMYVPRSFDSVHSETYLALKRLSTLLATRVCGQRLTAFTVKAAMWPLAIRASRAGSDVPMARAALRSDFQ